MYCTEESFAIILGGKFKVYPISKRCLDVFALFQRPARSAEPRILNPQNKRLKEGSDARWSDRKVVCYATFAHATLG
ncbi:hypothetical protein M413DRAFT_143988 [Hebeloma cylindrosporum]|uniref:Uncharacterized protein n=1 Tax=Hebeloma cylindrosporum TaxID=76867 RepID=A0A0C2YM55_HEBCY|nr:hypothetical protein M413DRAFT_143988 [Hebeloma cylindrosporum h7]